MSEKRPGRDAQGNSSGEVTPPPADAENELPTWVSEADEEATRRALPVVGPERALDQPIPACSQDTTVELGRQASALAAQLQPDVDADATIELPADSTPDVLPATATDGDATTTRLGPGAPLDLHSADETPAEAASVRRLRPASVRLAPGEPLDLHSGPADPQPCADDEKSPSSLRLAPDEPLDLHSETDLDAGTVLGAPPATGLIDADSSDLDETVVHLPDDLRRITSAPTVVVADMLHDPGAPTFKADKGLIYDPDSARLLGRRDAPTVRHDPDAPTLIDLAAIQQAAAEPPDPDDIPTPPSLLGLDPNLQPDGPQ